MKQRFDSLQVLRFVTALGVVLYHLKIGVTVNGVQYNVFELAYWGVDIFFVISGFILCLVSENIRPREFAAHRVARVVPTYWLLTLGVAVIALIAPSVLKATVANASTLAKSLFFVPYRKSNGLVQPILFVGWTLNYEMFFYALFSCALLSPRWRHVGLVASLVCLAVIGKVVHFESVPLAFWTNGIILEFALGIALYHLSRRGVRIPIWAPIIAVPFVLFLVSRGIILPREIAAGIPAFLIVGSTLSISLRPTRAAAVLVLLGDASYALYLIHPYVEQVGDLVVRHYPASGVILWTTRFAGVGGSLLAALVFYRYVERPMHRYLRARIDRGAPSVVTAPTSG